MPDHSTVDGATPFAKAFRRRRVRSLHPPENSTTAPDPCLRSVPTLMRILLCAALLAPSAALVVPSQHHPSVSVSPQLRSSASLRCPRSASLRCPRSPAVAMQAEELTPGVGEGRNLPSPSGINTYPLPLQAATVLGIAAGIALLAALIAGPGFDAVRGSGPWNLSRPTWPLLGFIYLAAGIAHFTEEEGFTNICPPNGTWGLCAAAGRTPCLVPAPLATDPGPSLGPCSEAHAKA